MYKPKFEVITGNIGTVFIGTSYDEAVTVFNEYISQSVNGYGKASGESVYLMEDNELIKEYIGEVDMFE